MEASSPSFRTSKYGHGFGVCLKYASLKTKRKYRICHQLWMGPDRIIRWKTTSSCRKWFFNVYMAWKHKFLSFYRYIHNTPKKLKLVDAYLTYVFFTGVIQFLYCCLVGTFPFNAFLSGFISCVGSFILGVCLRLQVEIVKINLNSVPKLFLQIIGSRLNRFFIYFLF